MRTIYLYKIVYANIAFKAQSEIEQTPSMQNSLSETCFDIILVLKLPKLNGFRLALRPPTVCEQTWNRHHSVDVPRSQQGHPLSLQRTHHWKRALPRHRRAGPGPRSCPGKETGSRGWLFNNGWRCLKNDTLIQD